MRAHVGTLGPATLTDRSENGLLAELWSRTMAMRVSFMSCGSEPVELGPRQQRFGG
jgi:hypothetical protein